jgi:hypothetical protein
MVFFNPSLAQKLAVTLTKKQNASGVKKSRSQVHKYLYEGALPRRDAMLQIFDITDGDITPNDFFDIYPQIERVSRFEFKIKFVRGELNDTNAKS